MTAAEAFAQEITQIAQIKLRPTIESMAREAFEKFCYSPDMVLTIPKAQKIFDLSREAVEQVLIEQAVPVRFQKRGGMAREARLFQYGDFAAGVRRWIGSRG